MAGWSWAVPLFALVGVLAFLPDGRSAGAGKWCARLLVGGVALVVGTGLHPVLLVTDELPTPIENSVGMLPAHLADGVAVGGLLVLLAVAFAAVITLVVRSVRGDVLTHRQLLLLSSVAVLLLVLAVLPVGDTPLLVGIALVPAAVLVATLSLGLYEVDAVVARALAAAVLGVPVALSYVVAVSGAGVAVGSGDGTALAVAVTAGAGLLLQPVKRGCARFVQRVVHGTTLHWRSSSSASSRRPADGSTRCPIGSRRF